MKKQTSKQTQWTKMFLILPMVSLLLYGFSEKKVVPVYQENASQTRISPNNHKEAILEKLSKYNTLAKKYNAPTMDEREVRREDILLMEQLYHSMSVSQKRKAEPLPKYANPTRVSQEGATEEQVAEYNALAQKYNTMLEAKGNIFIQKSEVERLEYLYSIMTEAQRQQAEPFPGFPEPPEPPNPPSPPNKSEKEIAEEVIEEIIENQDPYDHVNNVPIPSPYGEKNLSIRVDEHVKKTIQMENEKSDIERQVVLLKEQQLKLQKADKEMQKQHKRLEKEALKMEKEARKTEQQVRIMEKQQLKVKKGGKEMQKQHKRLEKEALKMEKEALEMEKKVMEMEKNIPPAPPAPPTPISPLESIKELAQQGAIFYHNGKKITGEEAVAIVKNSDVRSMEVKEINGQPPVVRIKTNP